MLTRWWGSSRLAIHHKPVSLPPSPSPELSPRKEKRLRAFLLPYVQRFRLSSRTTQAEFPQKTAPTALKPLRVIETIGRCFQNVAAGRAGSALGEALAELGRGLALSKLPPVAFVGSSPSPSPISFFEVAPVSVSVFSMSAISSSPETCLGRYDSRISTCAAKSGALLVVPRLDGALERLLRLLDRGRHGVVGVRDLAALVHLDVLHFAVHLAQDGHARFVVRLQRGLHFVLRLWYFMIPSFLLRNRFSLSIVHNLAGPCDASAKRRQMPSMP